MKGKKEKKEKRYFFSIVEEVIMNTDYAGYRGGRVEVYDNRRNDGYASYEARLLIPEEFWEGFREVFDMKHSDLPVYIVWKEDK